MKTPNSLRAVWMCSSSDGGTPSADGEGLDYTETSLEEGGGEGRETSEGSVLPSQPITRESCLSVVDDPCKYSDMRERQEDRDSPTMNPAHTSMQTLAGLYAILLVVLGISLPLSVFLSGSGGHSALYLSIFQILIYMSGTIFLAVLNIYMRTHKNRHYKKKDNEERSEKELPQQPPTNGVINGLNVAKRAVVASILPQGSEPGQGHELSRVAYPHADECLFCYSGEGVNFFLRLGAIGFGMASIALDGFQLSQFMDKEAWKCLGTHYLFATLARLFFVFTQTHFIFKQHRIVINFHKSWVRLGLLHLVATNLCTWAATVALESVEAFIHLAGHEDDHGEDHGYGHADNTSGPHGSGSYNNTSDHYPMEKPHRPPDVVALVRCLEGSNSLSAKASPYLYPCAIEFSLISAAIVYRIFCHVGANVDKEKRHRERLANSVMTAISGECQKAHTGLFLGLLLVICSIIGLFFFLSYEQSGKENTFHLISLIHTSTDSAVHLISIMALAIAFYKVTRLHFTGKLDNSLDQNLVIVAVSGHFLLFVFILVPAIQVASESEYSPSRDIYVDMMVSLAFLTLIQSAVQVTFIVDGLRRRSSKAEHFRHKPGRSVITFLILCNLAMWSANSFQLKSIHNSPIHLKFFGPLAWNIIVHLCLPLAIFFRFHSCICLSDIWMTAYSVDSDHVGQKDKFDEDSISDMDSPTHI